jgi:signal transduction histidine kinase
VRIRVSADGDAVVLSVVDDGAPVGPARTPGFGIVGMSERVALLGGTLVAGPGIERGWAVEARVPRSGVKR